MAIQGELWTSLEQMNTSLIRKWLFGSVLVRDWDPAGTTSLLNFTPFNSDGSLKTTLFSASNPGGPWFDVGSIDVNGVDFTPRLKASETDVWQSRWPERMDMDGDGEDIMVECVETNPVALALFNNQPLVGVPGTGAVSVLQSVGAQNFSVQYSNVPQVIWRQLLIIGVDGELANPLYVAELRPRVSIIKLAKRQMNAKKADSFGLTFAVYPDTASGFVKNALYGGPAWIALGGSPVLAAPDYISLAPPTINTATIVPSTLVGTPSGTGGTFAAGTYYWTMTATTAAGESIRGNEITATLSGSTSSNALTWTQVQGAVGYKIYRGTSPGAEGTLVTTIGSGATVSYTDTGTAGTAGQPSVVNNATILAPASLAVTGSTTGGVLPIATDYWVLTALTAQGETTRSNEVTATLTTNTSSGALTWSATSGASGYRLYRGTVAGAEGWLAAYIPSGATTSFTDTGVSVEATALTSHQVQLQFQQPVSGNGPYVYTITQTTGGSTTPITLVSGPTTVASGLVTVTGGSLTASSVYTFNVTVAAADGATVSYPVSNSITAT